jgi:hypothetical protein
VGRHDLRRQLAYGRRRCEIRHRAGHR